MNKFELSIISIQIEAIKLPLKQPLKTATHDAEDVYCLLVSLHTNDGLYGEGYAFCWAEQQLQAIAAMAASIAPRFIGCDPHEIEGLWATILRDNNFYGQAGISIIALAPFDVACWDLIGKAAQRPLHQLFGSCRKKIPVYASGGLFLPTPIAGLEAEAKAFVNAGYRAIKIRLGRKRWQDDVERVAAVRQAIGSDIELMADANQSLSAVDALRLGKELEPFRLAWFEEPVVTWNDRDSAALTRSFDTPVASGETEYTRYGIRRMVENKAADIYMPDLQRMGGFSEMRKTVHYLATCDLPVSPHLFTEQSIHIAASSPNVTWCEATDWFNPLYREKLTLNCDGTISLPTAFGVGFTFDREGLEDYWVPLKL